MADHAALTDITERVFAIPQGLMHCGHGHVPRAVRLADGRLILKPDSVGAPGFTDDHPPDTMAAGTPFVSYGSLDQTPLGWQPAFRLLPYDTTRAMAKAGTGSDRASALKTGWIQPG